MASRVMSMSVAPARWMKELALAVAWRLGEGEEERVGEGGRECAAGRDAAREWERVR
jgi:hypothetical protein